MMRRLAGGDPSSPPRVLALGARLAALEAAFLLDTRLSGRADLQLVCELGDFVLRPNLVYVPFGADPAASALRIVELLDRHARGVTSKERA
jgi:hypothetical protein